MNLRKYDWSLISLEIAGPMEAVLKYIVLLVILTGRYPYMDTRQDRISNTTVSEWTNIRLALRDVALISYM